MRYILYAYGALVASQLLIFIYGQALTVYQVKIAPILNSHPGVD